MAEAKNTLKSRCADAKSSALKAPFPYFGGKSRVASIIWERFGDVKNYVEPFAGSLAVLLARPHEPKTETVNDADCYLANFWRALKHDPEAVAEHADWPVNETDLHSRHLWLIAQHEFRRRLKTDPDYFDPKIAGWWVWGISSWIGSGWCRAAHQKIPDLYHPRGVHKKRPHLGDAGMGVSRQLPHLGNAGRGVSRQLPHLGNAGRGARRTALIAYFDQLAARLNRVRVCCCNWSRVCGPSVTFRHGPTGVFLDPPYAAEAGRAEDLYSTDCPTVAHDARAWAIEQGKNPLMRIALCGYEGEHKMPKSWACVAWKSRGGYGSQAKKGRGRDNAHRERIWFSPHCLDPD